MRAIAVPDFEHQVVYQTCINSIADESLRSRLNHVSANIADAANEYKQKAQAEQLYTIPPNNSRNDDIVLGAVTKKELKDVYNLQMVRRSKPARKIYDLLLSQAPFGLCPFCGFGHATTLDHYLPKTKYPQLSVLPLNLVPCCKDCNTGKRTTIAVTAQEQSLHPYFDHQKFINEQWLFAEVKQTAPATVYFFVEAPDSWDEISRARVHSHFNDFNLASRYSIEASNQLACLRHSLADYLDVGDLERVRQHLMAEARAYARQHKNSWDTAMFQALAASDWYCNGGFDLI
jgi:5-methylcytosine-specific restriction endonuclease McrA